MSYPEKIKKARLMLGKNQTEFGKLFGNTAMSVSLWESGQREANYDVLEYVDGVLNRMMKCPKCKGLGVIGVEGEKK